MINSQIRAFVRSKVLDCLGSFSKPAPGIHILNGHRIQDEPEPDTFRFLLNELSQYVEFIKIEDAVQDIIHHEQPDNPLVAFTFDDGFMECYEVFAPILEDFHTNALFSRSARPCACGADTSWTCPYQRPSGFNRLDARLVGTAPRAVRKGGRAVGGSVPW